MEKLESVLRFDKYIVDEVVFKTNPEFNPTDDKLKINFSIKKDVKHKDNGQMVVSLQVNIFEKANEKQLLSKKKQLLFSSRTRTLYMY